VGGLVGDEGHRTVRAEADCRCPPFHRLFRIFYLEKPSVRAEYCNCPVISLWGYTIHNKYLGIIER